MFDAYHEWLGIPAGEQPPNHYRLLGIPVFEESDAVIENAADQRMGHLRTFQSGAHSAESQRLLGEVAAARVCLLNPQKKALYDQALRQRVQPGSGPAESSDAFFLDPELATALTTRKPSTAAGASAGRRKKSRSNPTMLIAVAALTVTAVGLLVLWLATGNSDAPSDPRIAKVADSAAPARPVQEAAAKPPRPVNREIPLVASTEHEEEPERDDLIAAPVAKPAAPQSAAQAPAPADEDVSGDSKPVAGESPLAKPAAMEENAAAKKLEPPSASEQKRLMSEIDEVYKPGEAKDPAAKAALARKLLEDGRKNEANRSEQFVMFRRAAEIARDAGQADLMLEAADAIAAAGFDIRSIPMKSRLLKRLVEQGARGDASRLSAASACCIRFAEAAAASGAFGEAAELVEAARKSLAKANLQAQADLRMAKAAAARIREPTERAKKAELERKVDEAQADVDAIKSAHAALAECGKGIEQSRRERAAIQAAQERLKTAPDDPEACLAVGRWRCFEQGDWAEGLKLLAKGSDASLKGLAEEDLASKPAAAEDRVARGDAWWNVAEKAANKSKIALRKRAGQWYQEALPDLSPGLGKSRVEKRLAEVADELPQGDGRPAGPRPPTTIAPFNEKTARQHQARWAKYLGVPVVQTNSIGMKLVLIPPGEFTMGAPDLETAPQHHVRITKPFYLGENLVTQQQWEAEMGSNPSHFKGAKNPVETVGWDDCMVFLGKLNAKTGRQKGKFVLPTEAQWEYACRAGSTSHYCFGDNEPGLGDYAWYEANSNRTTHPVGEKKPNAWGLYDMHGNVSQWCQDWYDAGYYLHSPADDPTGPDTGSNRVGRGGCWFGPASVCCSDGRAKGSPEFRGNGLGLRVCQVPAE